MDQSPEQRNITKRKSQDMESDNLSDRPTKQLRVQAGTPMSTTDFSTNGETNGHDDDADMEDEVGLSRTATGIDTAEWQATIERVVKNVVSIHFCQTCSFDTDSAISSEATGFVVDAEKGYILTNRHVVGPGPFWGYCIFDNHEECDVHPVYRDPVHDFGILRFDPKAIKYMAVKALELRPDLARIGSEIRVVGNDAGEKLSILQGVISRLDRNAPDYGEGYSDFNTNYIQAAAAASGGSSGSPVVNIDGKAVALQAGGRADGAATDYFLPLDRPLRALRYIQKGEDVPRGSIQTQWLLKPFDDCRRLGLRPETEAMVRKEFPDDNNMLVAEVVLPNGPAGGKLEEGDVLVRVNGQLISRFIPLDDLLDSHVDKSVKLLVQRGGEDVEVEVTVGDLHEITPSRFVTVAGAAFHDLSYQQARLYAISLKDQGTYVAEAAGSFKLSGSESGWLIKSVDNKETPNLDTFIEVMKGIPDRARVVIQYVHLRDLHTINTLIIHIDRHWSTKMRLAVRNDKTGLWDFSNLSDPLPAVPQKTQEAQFIQIANSKFKKATEIVKSFVKITANMPIKLDGYPRGRKTGYGLVVDAEKGLVVVSRAIVPYDMCDIAITIADSIIIDGKVVFMHPLQNYAIIQYDPSLVSAPVQSARLAKEVIQQGDETIFFGFNQNYRPVVVRTSVTDITTVGIPASAATPRYRATNVDAVTVDTNMASQCGNGVLMREDGTVQALWLTYMGERSSHSNRDVEYHLGLMTPGIIPVIEQIQAGTIPQLRILNCETHSIQMSQARIMGVGEEWIRRVEQEDPERHQLFMVRKVDFGHTNGLRESDVILTLNGRLITRVSDLDIQYNNDVLEAVIVRKRQQMTLSVPTVPTADLETTRAILFCGAVLHRPHHAVRQQISKLHSEVYVSGRMRGSPAYMYGLAPTNFLTHVNGVPTPDLDSFLKEAIKIPDNTYFRLKVMTFDNVPWVATMKKNEHYFPTMEFVKDSAEELGWKRVVHESEKGGSSELGDQPTMDVDGGMLDEGAMEPERGTGSQVVRSRL